MKEKVLFSEDGYKYKSISRADVSKSILAYEHFGIALYNASFTYPDLCEKLIMGSMFNGVTFPLEILNYRSYGCNYRSCTMRGMMLRTKNKADVKKRSAMSLSKFVECDLSYGNWTSANLSAVVFRRCRMHSLVLDDCDLSDAVFINCDMSTISLKNATLDFADFSRSDLPMHVFYQADFTFAKIAWRNRLKYAISIIFKFILKKSL